jgi:selenocysteine-specific elongation factor
MFVLGTAGHVDHGKSSLVKALTNIDPDRLPEEKAREMTVDLGFADLILPSGNHVSIVDVPGHEKFIKNMLSGVGSIDLALLIVAADESVMPQTIEHLSILDTLKIPNSIVVITKCDLVDEEIIAVVKEEIIETIQSTSIKNSPIISVSSVTLDGLDALKTQIDSMLISSEPPINFKIPRLPIDRCFTISGFGTVVTGTLIDGPLRISQEIEIANTGVRGRIRGLQSHSEKVEITQPGVRLAVNLSGISKSEINRGDILTIPNTLQSTKIVDVQLTISKMSPQTIKHNQGITFHAFTSECNARVRILNASNLSQDETGACQILLQEPLTLVKGDSYIIRSSEYTLGGGIILDPHPKRRHKRFDDSILNHFLSLESGDDKDVIIESINKVGNISFADLCKSTNLTNQLCIENLTSLIEDNSVIQIRNTIDSALAEEEIRQDGIFFSSTSWNMIKNSCYAILSNHHELFPLRPGMRSQELRNRLELKQSTFTGFIAKLTGELSLLEIQNYIKLPDHNPVLDSKSLETAKSYLAELTIGDYSPSTEYKIENEILEYLIFARKIIRVSESILYPVEILDKMNSILINYLTVNDTITVAEARTLFESSRKYMLPYLEYLDQQQITIRTGDYRSLRKK